MYICQPLAYFFRLSERERASSSTDANLPCILEFFHGCLDLLVESKGKVGC